MGQPLNALQKVLSPAQRHLLRKLGPFARERGFFLGGGTALALQLVHRKSDDFDWFINNELADPDALALELRNAGIPFEHAKTSSGTLSGLAAGVPISFMRYRYPMLTENVPS